jgi:hypothetical protein
MPADDDVAARDDDIDVDPYDCDACLAVEDICLFHRGFATGWDACAAAVARVAAEDYGDAA